MPRVTKADLEQQLAAKEEELNNYRKWLFESEEKYNKLTNEIEEQFKLLPVYAEMIHRIERLEIIKQSNEDTIKRKEEKEKN